MPRSSGFSEVLIWLSQELWAEAAVVRIEIAARGPSQQNLTVLKLGHGRGADGIFVEGHHVPEA